MQSVSIIIPIYKTASYIGACLDSIIKQECDIAKIECILVNDHTPDNSMEIVTEKLRQYTGDIDFKILNHAENQGLSIARNTGTNAATGDYILFVDSDDILVPGTIQSFIECIAETTDIDIVVGNAITTHNHKKVMNIDGSSPILIDNTNEDALRKFLRREIFHTAWNKLLKRNLLIKNNLYFITGLINEDLLWAYQIFLHSKKTMLIPKVTYIYQDENPSSITNTSDQKMRQNISSRITTCSLILHNPPKKICPEYFSYIYYILMVAINLHEENKTLTKDIESDIYQIRDLFLERVWNEGYILLYLNYLTLKKPFYYVIYCKLFRRYFDRISKFTVRLSK